MTGHSSLTPKRAQYWAGNRDTSEGMIKEMTQADLMLEVLNREAGVSEYAQWYASPLPA